MAKNDGDVSICFPGEDRWELWRLKSGRFELADTATVDDSGVSQPFKTASHYAFPVNSVFAVPIWSATDDPSVLGNVVEMQLEKSGLKPESGAGVAFDYKKVGASDATAPAVPLGDGAAASKRHLILANVLNTNYEHPLPKTGSKEFDVSARFLVLPGNHIVIWKELGRLVLALTRGSELVYFQGLTGTEVDAATVQEIKCLLLGLEGQGIIARPSGIHLWLEHVDDAAGDLLQRELGLDAIVTPRPDPVFATKTSALLPEQVALQRIQAKRSAKIRNIAAVIALVYLAFVGWYLFDYFSVLKEEKEVASRASELAPEAEWIRPFQGRWKNIEPVLDGSRYPSELLHRCTTSLPQKNVRFTGFTVAKGVITILGEASDTGAARKFAGDLFKSSLLTDYDWIWLQRPAADPRRKDGTAVFRIQGTYKFNSA